MGDRRPLGTTKQVAEHLAVPVQTLYDWRLRGAGPRAIRVGKHLRYRWDDVERWLDEQAQRDAPDSAPLPTRAPRRKSRGSEGGADAA